MAEAEPPRAALSAAPASAWTRREIGQAAAGSALALLLLAAIPAWRPLSQRRYRFRVSSTMPGYAESGWLSDQGPYGLLFHTHRQKDPWVELDLGGERVFESVWVRNRLDCCRERALPLVCEIAGPDRVFREIARTEEVFETWTVDNPGGLSAAFVRLRVHAVSMLHLTEIAVR